MNQDKLLNEKNAIITGCSSGIGLEILRVYCENGANVWAFVRSLTEEFETEIRRLKDEYGCWIEVVPFDLLDADSIKHAVKAVSQAKKTVDILVNNAGIPCHKTLMMTSVKELQQVMNANFIAPSLLMQLISRLMARKKNGTIINITSRSGIEDRSGVYGYGSSKAALIWSTKAAARELSDFNIRVNGIAPGLIETKMGSCSRSDEEIQEYVRKNDIKRPGTTREIANTALFLASDLSSYISGQIISVDGGRN